MYCMMFTPHPHVQRKFNPSLDQWGHERDFLHSEHNQLNFVNCFWCCYCLFCFLFLIFFLRGRRGTGVKENPKKIVSLVRKCKQLCIENCFTTFLRARLCNCEGCTSECGKRNIHPRSRRFMNVFSKIAMLVIFFSHFSGKKPVACAWDVIKTMAAFVKDDCWYSRLHLQFNYTTVFDLQVNLKMMPLSSHHIVYLVISQNWMGYIASLTAHFDNGRW